MPVEKMKDEAKTLLIQRAEATRPDLGELKIRIVGLMYTPKTNDAGETVGPPLKHQGREVCGKVKITKAEDRQAGMPDAVITLDGDGWQGWDEDRRIAVMDEALYAIQVVKDKEGTVQLDEALRTRLKIREPDVYVNTYAHILETHRDAAPGWSALRLIGQKFKQKLLPI